MDRILLGHGSGGKLMHELIREHFGPSFGIEGFGDAAILDLGPQKLAFTTDSYVVSLTTGGSKQIPFLSDMTAIP